jgi:hypothetical protein
MSRPCQKTLKTGLSPVSRHEAHRFLSSPEWFHEVKQDGFRPHRPYIANSRTQITPAREGERSRKGEYICPIDPLH